MVLGRAEMQEGGEDTGLGIKLGSFLNDVAGRSVKD